MKIKTVFSVGLYILLIGNSILTTNAQQIKTSNTGAETIRDIDGNVYKTVKIGDQEWMAENLRTTKFNNGKEIKKDDIWSDDIFSASYCLVESSRNTITEYGHLYDMQTILTQNNVCPVNWRVPTISEWESFLSETDYIDFIEIGMSRDNRGYMLKLKTIFMLQFAGIRDSDGTFSGFGKTACFWAIGERRNPNIIEFEMLHDFVNIYDNLLESNKGASVRCIKQK
jgi:uncharacterized protein (TIGR02145 family)